MSGGKAPIAFVDSNVVLYLLSKDAVREKQALDVIQTRPWISVQVLNEVTDVGRKKAGMAWTEISDFLKDVRHFCPVAPLTEAIHDDTRRLAERYQLSLYDACIVAAALSVKASTVWSQGMHTGLVVDGILTIKNPFGP
jgi:predicted nucleic acid-binding protein